MRNAENPAEPQRFLLTKSEVPVWKQQDTPGDATPEEIREAATTASASGGELRRRIEALERREATTKSHEAKEPAMPVKPYVHDAHAHAYVSAGARKAIERAAQTLSPYRDEPQVAALINKLTLISDPGADSVDRITKAIEDLGDAERALTAKSGGRLDQADRELIRKSSRDLQAEYLARASPAGYAAWERSCRQAGFAV